MWLLGSGSFPGPNGWGKKLTFDLATSATMKNKLNYTSAPPKCLHGVDTETLHPPAPLCYQPTIMTV